MRQKLLNSVQDRWLFENYDTKSNKELKSELDEMIRSSNCKKIAMLKLNYENADNVSKKIKILERIRKLEAFEGLTPHFIVHYARRMGYGKKTSLYRSKKNRETASRVHLQRMMDKAEEVTVFYQWFRTFKLNDCKIGHVQSRNKLDTLQCSLCNWNREKAKNTGVMLVPEYHKEALLVKVVAKLYVKI